MDTGAIFATAFVVGLTGAMAPGPLLTVTVAEAARRGFWVGPLLVVGHGILEGSLVAGLAAGLAGLLRLPWVTGMIALVGGVFLLWMGYTIARDAARGRLTLEGIDTSRAGESAVWSRRQAARLVGLGAAISLSNPYWSLWWATIGLTYVTFSLERGGVAPLAFFSGHILSDFAWYALVAAAVAGSRRFLPPLVYRVVLTICGVFLVFLAAYFIYTGLVKFHLLG
ncbi:MAG: LysE family transporter [Desulfotomaculales bacterium]